MRNHEFAEGHAATSTAKKIIEILEGRKGFDYWWEEVDESARQEIMNEIDDQIREDWES